MHWGLGRQEMFVLGLVLILGLAACTVVVFLALRYLARSRELLSAERRAAMEKGLDAPSDLALGLPRRFRWNPLKLAILLIGAGTGLVLNGAFFGDRAPLMYGVFIVTIGLANLAYYRLGGKQEWEREAALHEELYRAHLRRLEAPHPAERREGDRT